VVIRRLPDYFSVFQEEDPLVYILSPTPDRLSPAGDTRRGTAWLFRSLDGALEFSTWMQEKNGVRAVPVQVHLRRLSGLYAEQDLTFVLDPAPRAGYGDPLSFKAPLAH
jgi:hypothetical protein